MGRARSIAAALALLASSLTTGGSLAADIAGAPPPAALRPGADAALAAIESYLERRAALLGIRARFAVIAPEDIAPTLARDLEALKGAAPSAWLDAALDEELLTEASYFLVSLSYLIDSGGPLWPGDRSEAAYADDARVILDAVRAELLSTIEGRADPLPLLERLEQVHWWTEGEATPPGGGDIFSDLPALVGALLDSAGPRSST